LNFKEEKMMIPYLKTAQNLLSRNASDLLLVGGVGCILAGGILAIRQTPKAVQISERMKDETKVEKIKTIAPLYIPSILLTSVGITQIVCSRNITNNKLAAVATAYTISESAFRTYKEKVRDIVEPEKYEEIKREYATERARRDPVSSKEVIIQSTGDDLIYDNSSGRYFKGSLNEIEKVVNTLNKRMRSDMTITLNEFYSEVGLPLIKTGEFIGWSIDKDDIEIYTSGGLADDGRPYILLELMGFTSI
jgi:hypothetical protein